MLPGGAEVGNFPDEVHTLVDRGEVTKLVRMEGQTFTDVRVLLDGSDWVN